MSQVTFIVYARPEPQGSIKSFRHKTTGTIICTSTNKSLKPFRGEVCRAGRRALRDGRLEEPMAAKHVPVEVDLEFVFLRPHKCSRTRVWPVVKPDIDKLERAVLDALTGVLWADDGQVVIVGKRKVYGPVEQVQVSARIVTEGASHGPGPLRGETQLRLIT